MIDVNLRGVLHGIAAALPVFRRQGRGHFVTTVSTSGLKIVPTQAVYAGTKNAVRTLLEALRQESTDGVLRTTSISPATCAPNSPTTSTTPTSGNRCGAGWRHSASALTPWRVPSHSQSSSPTTSRSATSPSGPLTKTDNGQPQRRASSTGQRGWAVSTRTGGQDCCTNSVTVG